MMSPSRALLASLALMAADKNGYALEATFVVRGIQGKAKRQRERR